MARSTASMAVLANAMFNIASAVPAAHPRSFRSPDPFTPIDAQNWVNPDNMTWDDFVAPPSTSWSDPARKGRDRNFNIAMVTIDYPDSPFVVTLPANSDIFGNPQPLASGLKREDVPKFYKDLLNTPNDLNEGHTLHEYWMGDSFGKYGVDLTVFGPYRMPSRTYQYGVDDEEGGFNEGACPEGPPCSVDLRTDALGAWRADVGNATADLFELAFILSAGQDESSTWQEFGEMKFLTKEDIPDEFGPPANSSLPNWAETRYVNWTSWAAASTIWPNAGGGSSTQGESSGMATFAHELSHLLGIGDNYNNPYSVPPRRAYTGPFSMLDRGSFNGPGGPHTRWQIPPVQGASMGSLHTMRDKHQIALIDNTPILQISRAGLAISGPVIAEITARSVDPGTGLMGFNVTFGTEGDLSPACNTSTDALCDGGAYDNYNMEVVDRMGADSFCPDSGVMISKTRNSDRRQPFQWVIDANPQDAHVVDFYLPNGTARYWSIGDYRQLVDALFHAGTNSGSEFEHIDAPNGLHLYVLDITRDAAGILKYTVGVRSTRGTSAAKHGVKLSDAHVESASHTASYCTFALKNTGKAPSSNSTAHPQDLTAYLGSDIYRLEAEIKDGKGWKVAVPNALAYAKAGETTSVRVAVGAGVGASEKVTVRLTATSESDPSVKESKTCKVKL
ncbi:M6 metalloprotease [Dothidotthia symphoricarpi CBS 119687]|uniref:M6 metalloprotease n=1 Tax=Dothidotthia symphoricarpi CBS 119687 TaxID=1392245 RepID=A0A6A6A9G3_9PLEO|nr:M6 metalloprotease [Dothidotthia symphoricarpi CBS 119687]KAF2127744.1 M6 metalloprotease [Dothidotthia symphoricarpi CBS 119687]